MLRQNHFILCHGVKEEEEVNVRVGIGSFQRTT